MIDWIKLGIGAVMLLPLATILFFGLWAHAQAKRLSFSDFVKRTLTTIAKILMFFILFFILASMTARGLILIWEAFR